MAENGESEEVIFYITKDEFKKRMQKNQELLSGVGKEYCDALLRAKTEKEKKWIKTEVDQIAKDMDYNLKMIKQADIEQNYVAWYMNANENIFMKRVGKEGHDRIYKLLDKKPSYVI